MESTKLKSILKHCDKCEFKHALKFLKDNLNAVDGSTCVKIMISICTGCRNEDLIFDHMVLCELLDKLVWSLNSLSNVEKDQYLQSIFHISKRLQREDSFSVFIKLRVAFLPRFLSDDPLTEKQMRTYISVYKSLYNFLIKITNAKIHHEPECILQFCLLLQSMSAKLNQDLNFLEFCTKCYTCLFLFKNVTSHVLNQYYISTLNSLEKCSIKSTKAYCKALLTIFFQHFINMVKLNDFSNAFECYESTSSKITNLFTSCEEIQAITNTLKVSTLISSVGVQLSKSNALYKLVVNGMCNLKHSDWNDILLDICNFLRKFVLFIINYYEQENCKEMIQYKSDVHLHWYMFLINLGDTLKNLPLNKCTCTNNCSINTNYNDCLSVLSSIGTFTNMLLKANYDLSDEHKLEVLASVKQEYNYICELKMKNCEHWKIWWSNAGATLYNIGVKLNDKKDEMCIKFLLKFVKYVYKLERTLSTPKIIKNLYVTAALEMIINCYIAKQQYKNGIGIAALNVAISQTPKEQLKTWIRLKVTCRNDIKFANLQALSIIDALKSPVPDVKYICPNFEVDQDRKIQLLCLELEAYKAKWNSKIPMMTVFKQLKQAADTFTVVKTISSIWGECTMHTHESVPRLIQETAESFKQDLNSSCEDDEKYLNLAQILLISHKYRAIEVATNKCDDINRTIMNSDNEAMALTPDTDIKCDTHLSIPVYVRTIQCLKESLEILQRFVPKLCRNELNMQTIEPVAFYKLLKMIGHEYKLHALIPYSATAWNLALKVAKALNRKYYILESISHLIDGAIAKNDDFVLNLIAEGDAILKQDNSVIDELEIVITFLISKATAFLSSDVSLAQEAFNCAEELIGQLNVDGVKNTIKERLKYLKHKLLILPCLYGVVGHEQYGVAEIHSAYHATFACYMNATSNDSAYNISLLFDITEGLAKMYRGLRMPRETMCYSKGLVLLAQSLNLPLRAAYLLNHMAYANATMCSVDELRVQMTDLADILAISDMEDDTEARERSLLAAFDDGNDDVFNKLGMRLKNLVLDLPKIPEPSTYNFNLPSCADHPSNCMCFYCTCTVYHTLVLKHSFLTALYYLQKRDVAKAKEFFCKSIHLYEWCNSLVPNLEQKFEGNSVILSNYRSELFETYGWVLFEYCDMLQRANDLYEAKIINDKLLVDLKPKHIRFMSLYNEALVQKVNIYVHTQSMKKIQQKRVEMKLLCSPCSTNSTVPTSRTPETKQSTVTIPVSNRASPHILLPPKRVPPKFNLDNICNDIESTENVNTSSPSAKLFKTPSAKVKAYTGCSMNKRTKTPQTSSVQSKIASLNGPMSCDKDKQGVLKVRQNVENELASRTKLLTQHLKNTPTTRSKLRKGSTLSESSGLKQKSVTSDQEESAGGSLVKPPAKTIKKYNLRR